MYVLTHYIPNYTRMTHLLILGGSPIYGCGLVYTLQQAFPGARVEHRALNFSASTPARLILLVAEGLPLNKLVSLLGRLVVPVLILGPERSLAEVRRLLAAGARGYLLSAVAATVLPRAVATIGEGGAFVDPELQRRCAERQLGLTPQASPITRREQQVLDLIIHERTTAEIAGELFISRCTVETHRSHLLRKLGVRNTAGIVREAIRRQLCVL